MNSEMQPSEFEHVWGRVKQLTQWTDYKELAAFVGSSSQSISGVKKRGKFPLEWARKIAQEFGSFTDYILDGQGPPKMEVFRQWYEKCAVVQEPVTDWLFWPPAEERSAPAPSKPDQVFLEQYVLVPRYEVAASAGGGAVVHSEQIVDYLSFKADWIRNGLGLSEKDLALINVKGDSMEPTLSNEDLILVDLRTQQVEDNAVYVLQFNGVLLVKRIQRKLDGTVIVRSDNTVYEPEVIGVERVEALNVIGRVVWCGRRM